MGTSGLCELRSINAGTLWVYWHYDAYNLPDAARKAFEKASPRRGGSTYWLRIMVDQLTKLGRDKENGFGLLIPSIADSFELGFANVKVSVSETGEVKVL